MSYIIDRQIFNSLRRYRELRTYVLKAVFSSTPFREYIKFLQEIGISRSAVLGRAIVKESSEDKGIWLTPVIGPHFSDADMFLIILRYHIMNNHPVTEMDIAQTLRTEIVKNNAATIMMLDKTSKQLFENGAMIPHPDMGFGRPDLFVKKYSAYIPDNLYNKYQVVEASRSIIKPGTMGIKVNIGEWFDFSNIKSLSS